MNFLILDVYPNNNYRLVKDTAGGYGTGNDFGKGLLMDFVNKFISNIITMPPIFAMYVYSIIKKNNQVEYSKEYDDNLIDKSDYIILISSIVAHESEIEALKKISKKKKVFIVGIFSNVLSVKYLLNKNCYVVPGEPEFFFLNIEYNKEVLDSYFTESNKKIDSKKDFTDNKVDDLPFPDWKYYSEKYPLRNNFLDFNSKIAIPIVATRGCPYSCFKYCTYPLQQGRKIRSRSADNVVDEIIYWMKLLKTNKFIFRDPVFTVNRKFTEELCKKIIEKDLKIVFLIETHLNNLDDDLINLLFKAGLRIIYVGIESVNKSVLQDISRFTISNDNQYRIIKKLRDKKIIIKSMFMLGNPEDSEETILETIKYSIKLPNQLVQYSIFTPYPGTPIYSEYKNKITESNFEKFNQYNLVFKHKNLDSLQILKLKELAYKKFYLRLNNIYIIFLTFFSILKK